MRTMTCTGWGCNREPLKVLFNSFIKIDYGLHVYSSAAYTHIQRLEVVQNSAWRVIKGSTKEKKISSLQFESNCMSIHKKI